MPRSSKREVNQRAAKAGRQAATEATLKAIEAQATEDGYAKLAGGFVGTQVADPNDKKIDAAKAWLDGKPAAQPAPKASNLNIAPVATPSSLIHQDGRQYDFCPRSEHGVVIVLAITRHSMIRTELPTEEARQLWLRLRGQGFEKW